LRILQGDIQTKPCPDIPRAHSLPLMIMVPPLSCGTFPVHSLELDYSPALCLRSPSRPENRPKSHPRNLSIANSFLGFLSSIPPPTQRVLFRAPMSFHVIRMCIFQNPHFPTPRPLLESPQHDNGLGRQFKPLLFGLVSPPPFSVYVTQQFSLADLSFNLLLKHAGCYYVIM